MFINYDFLEAAAKNLTRNRVMKREGIGINMPLEDVSRCQLVNGAQKLSFHGDQRCAL